MTQKDTAETLFPVNVCPSPDALPAGFLEFLAPLHARFTPGQRDHASSRKIVLAEAGRGNLPNYLSDPYNASIRAADWSCTVPAWCADQRNQMTGPADDAELVVKMLNSGAPGVMIDLEDSEANTWERLSRGVTNAVAALHGELTYEKNGKTVSIRDSLTVTFTRVRGLHMSQKLDWSDDVVSASVFDAALLVYQLDPALLKHPICLYVPKSESALEAMWWSDFLKALATAKGLAPDAIKCMALIEAHPMAYQMEEFLFHLKDHILGLNLGRWDYMASLIHFTMDDPAWVLPDRNLIPSDVSFFQNLRTLMVDICHRRGALAIGGMTALYPSRTDAELNARALVVLEKDKKNEASCGMDGAWTGHPDQNAIAVSQFPVPNQMGFRPVNADRRPNLRPLPTGIGKVTLDGTCAAIRTCILYRKGVLDGKGASLINGYMEDLATDRIYRNMIAQRVRHGAQADDGHGNDVQHTPQLVAALFNEVLQRIISTLPYASESVGVTQLRAAADITLRMIESASCDPV